MLIDHMSQGKSFYTFSAVIKVHPDTVNEWTHEHKEFSVAKTAGRAMEILWWEELLRAGAAGKVPNFNATSVIFALKNKSPQHWRDKHEIVSTINVAQVPFTPQEVRKVLENDDFVDAVAKRIE